MALFDELMKMSPEIWITNTVAVYVSDRDLL